MEFRYGIRPLVSDISSAAAAFRNRGQATEKTLLTKRASVKEQLVTVPSDSAATYAGYLMMTKHERGTHNRSYTAGVSYYKKPGVPSQAYQLGLSVEHLPSILWEVVPLSFVADWFYSTGDWLRAIQPNPTVQVLGGYVSCKTDSQVHLNIVKVQYSGGPIGYVSATSDYEMSRLERSCNAALPALPVRKIASLSLAQAIDSCILTIQRIPTAWKQAIAPLFGRRR
jgi:hypothetical protein